MGKEMVLLVDGKCVMCNWCVRFIAERNAAGNIFFETQQSEKGQQLLRKYDQPNDLSTVVLFEKPSPGDPTRAFTRSTAILRACGELSMPWKLLANLTVIPSVVRDTCYNMVAASRYTLFGKKDECSLPASTVRRQIKRAPPDAF
ncbi:hypothetical protein DIPPA_00569 [Diplonema papillatum]|nr:hypothetical protein DIPPA_00569 [Diplonema papillatum]